LAFAKTRDNFTLLDTALGYRLPERRGLGSKPINTCLAAAASGQIPDIGYIERFVRECQERSFQLSMGHDRNGPEPEQPLWSARQQQADVRSRECRRPPSTPYRPFVDTSRWQP
jgi:hypothetical protein